MRSRSAKSTRPKGVRRQRDPLPWKYCLLTLACGLFLVAGFFWAARSHFSSMDYGMKNAKLRKQIEELKAENRRLQLSREIALSPAEIKRQAKKLGLMPMTARNIEVVGAARPKPAEKSPAKPGAANPEQEKKETKEKNAEPAARRPDPPAKTAGDERKTGKRPSGAKIREQIARR